jgi:hypothetical protein
MDQLSRSGCHSLGQVDRFRPCTNEHKAEVQASSTPTDGGAIDRDQEMLID